MMTAEEQRLEQDRNRQAYWRRWGPYVSDRQWGTVREDYSTDGNAWAYLPHDHARSPQQSSSQFCRRRSRFHPTTNIRE